MKTFSLFILSLVVSVYVNAQVPPYVIYQSAPPPTTSSSTETLIFPPNFGFRNNNLFNDSGNEIVKKERVSSNALCVESGEVYPVQIVVSIARNGNYSLNCIGIKEEKDRWTSCNVKVYDLDKLYETSSNKSLILEYMEIAYYMMQYDGYTYLIGGKK